MLWRNDFVMYHVLPRFFCYCYFITHIKWDIIISASLTSLLKVWIWYRCENRTEHYYHHDREQLGFYKKKYISEHRGRCYCKLFYCKKRRELSIPEKWDPGPGIWDSSPATRHTGLSHGTRDLGLCTWDPAPYMWEPGHNTFTWNAGPILRNFYINTIFS